MIKMSLVYNNNFNTRIFKLKILGSYLLFGQPDIRLPFTCDGLNFKLY